MSHADLLAVFGHFLLLSLLAVGGAISAVPDMHRYLVLERGWMSEADFVSSVALAQAAPGPNLLFVAVLGWKLAGPVGAFATMAGMLLPSTLLTLYATRWAHTHRATRGVRAFTTGMVPLTLGLLAATGWLLCEPLLAHPGAWMLIAGSAIAMRVTRVSPVWLVGVGAVVGGMGYA